MMSETANRTLGGPYNKTVLDGMLNANPGISEGHAGPNASVGYEVKANDGSYKGEAGAQASGLQYDDDNQDIHVNAFQAKAGVEWEAGRGGYGAEAAARLKLVDIDTPYAGGSLAIGPGIGGSVGAGGVSFDAGVVGASIGLDKLGVSVLGTEAFIRPGNIAKLAWNGIKSLF